MSQESRVRLSPPPIEIGDKDGFSKNDLFGYGEFGGNLARVFRNVEGLGVVMLDDDWGAGKTTFAKQWAGHMRGLGHKVIYIDAFANDFHIDPFLMLAVEISAAFPGKTQQLAHFKKIAKGVGALISDVALKASSGGLVSRADIEKSFEERLNEVEKDRELLRSFKSTLEKLTEDAKTSPLVIIIDELDRCRPDFALRLLERIKHFFFTDRISFLLVCDMTQLSAMVQSAYGFGENAAGTYLEKFYNLRAVLPDDTRLNMPSKREKYIQYLWEKMNLDLTEGHDKQFRNNFTVLANVNKLSLRKIEKIAVHVALATARQENEDISLIYPLVMGLSFLRLQCPELYKRALNPKTENVWPEIKEALSMDEQYEARKWEIGWWRYAVDSSLSAQGDMVSGYHMNSVAKKFKCRYDIIPFYAQYIDGFTKI